MNWSNLLTAAAGAGGVAAAYVAGRYVYDDVMVRRFQHKTFQAKLNAFEQRSTVKALLHIPADERGRLGMIRLPGGAILNMDSHARFDGGGQVVYADPVLERLDRIDRRILALAQGPRGGAQDAVPELLADPSAPRLPTQISILDALGMSTPSLDSLVLGVTLSEDGRVVPVTRSLYQLMHLLAIGITGSGKSTWLLSFLSQIAMCKEEIEVVLVDVHGAAFNLASKWSKLRYPIARNNDQAKLVLEEVFLESERRAELFQERAPLAEDLASYNALVEEPLCPWLVVIDEGTLMLSDSSIAGYVSNAVQGTRQYGLYVFMTGQTGNATVIKSPIRSNFPTRVCYTTEKASMAAALGDTPPGDLEEIPGRGWARLKGHKTPIMMQAPYIRRKDFYNLIEHEGPMNQMPESKEEEGVGKVSEWADDFLIDTYNHLSDKNNKSEMCRKLNIPTGGASWVKLNERMIRLGKWD